jgi:hypothetical protein
MKFLRFLMAEPVKAPELTQLADKIWTDPPAGAKMLALYICAGLAFRCYFPYSG